MPTLPYRSVALWHPNRPEDEGKQISYAYVVPDANNSLQLYSSWGLACEVVGNSAHSVYFIDDPRRDLGQKVIVEGERFRSHKILG